jgi:hypothetical protein
MFATAGFTAFSVTPADAGRAANGVAATATVEH